MYQRLIFISLKIPLQNVHNEIYKSNFWRLVEEVISLVKVTKTHCACNAHCSYLLANRTLTSPKELYPVELLRNYFCRDLWFLYVYTLFQNYIRLKDSLNFPCITIKN